MNDEMHPNSHHLQICQAIKDKKFKKILENDVDIVATTILRVKFSSKIITIFGNGGSAADSQHLAGELMCTYQDRKRLSVPAIALTTDSSIITAWSNDFNYETVFSRQIEGLKQVNGLSIGLSTSGSSKNVLKALDTAKLNGAETVLVSGNRGPFRPYSMHIMLPSSDTAVVQTLTQIFYHSVCDKIDALLACRKNE